VSEQDGQWNSRRCTNLSAQANIQSTCVGSDLQVLKNNCRPLFSDQRLRVSSQSPKYAFPGSLAVWFYAKYVRFVPRFGGNVLSPSRWYSILLRAGRSRDRIPVVGLNFTHPTKPALGPIQGIVEERSYTYLSSAQQTSCIISFGCVSSCDSSPRGGKNSCHYF